MPASFRALILGALLFALAATPYPADAACTLQEAIMLPLSPCEWQRFRPRPGGPDPNASPCLPLTLTGTDSADRLEGEQGDDLIVGKKGADVLTGSWGDDTLKGGRGADTLNGSIGFDTLIPGRGDDTLTGGRAPDDFVFTKSGLGRKFITDFDSDEDCIVLSTENNASWKSIADIIASVKAVGSGNYVYTLRRGLKVETTVPLRAEDFEVK